MNQEGYTSVELLCTLIILVVVVSFWGVVLYVAWHFITKFW